MSTLIGEIGPTGMVPLPGRSLLLFEDVVVYTRSKGWRDTARMTSVDPNQVDGDIWDPSALLDQEDSWMVPMDSITSVVLRQRVQWWMVMMTFGLAALLPNQRCLTIVSTSGSQYVSWSAPEGSPTSADQKATSLLTRAFGEQFIYDRRRYFGRWPPESS